MSQTPVSGVKRVGTQDGTGDAVPGQLTRDDKGQWDFTGNGTVTPTQVTNRILNLEATQYSAAHAGLPSALPSGVGQAVAKDLLGSNPHLNQTDPDEAIASGAKFSANLNDLKKAIAPFLSNPEMARFLTDPSSSAASSKFGDVPSVGLSLPYEHA